MVGIQHAIFAQAAGGLNVSTTFPTDPGTDFTTVFGTHALAVNGPDVPVPSGTLQVNPTAGTSAALTYHNTIGIQAAGTQRATSAALAGGFQVQGMFARMTFGATGHNDSQGYWGDFLTTDTLRIIRVGTGGVEKIVTQAVTSAVYTGGGGFADMSFNCVVRAAGGDITLWLSKPGEADSEVCTMVGADTGTYETGYFGMLSFSNPPAPPPPPPLWWSFYSYSEDV